MTGGSLPEKEEHQTRSKVADFFNSGYGKNFQPDLD
jgi:hypothetical protein